MKITVNTRIKLNTREVNERVREAARLGLRDTIVAIHADAVDNSPAVTGNNRRSIASEVSGMGVVATDGEGGAERMVDEGKLEAAVYSTSGYGGYLEVGTRYMNARPYFRPALDRHSGELAENIKRHLNG